MVRITTLPYTSNNASPCKNREYIVFYIGFYHSSMKGHVGTRFQNSGGKVPTFQNILSGIWVQREEISIISCHIKSQLFSNKFLNRCRKFLHIILKLLGLSRRVQELRDPTP